MKEREMHRSVLDVEYNFAKSAVRRQLLYNHRIITTQHTQQMLMFMHVQGPYLCYNFYVFILDSVIFFCKSFVIEEC